MADDKTLNSMSPAALAVVALAVVVLMGIAFVAQFSYQLRTVTNGTAVQLVVPATNSSVAVGTTGQYPFLSDVTDCVNSTNATDTWASTNYVVNEGNADGGTVTNTGSEKVNGTVNCSIEYRADSDSQAAADSFNTGLAVFATFMAVIVLALVGKIIINLFRRKS